MDNKKSFSIGYAIAFLLLGAVVAYAAINLFGSKSADVANTPGHTFSVDLTGVPEGTELVPGDVQSLNPAIHNGSTTDYIYAFVSVSYNPDVYEITDPSWELVSEEDGLSIYSYSSGNQMIPVEMGQDAEFSCGMKVVSEGAAFAGVSEEDMKYTVTGYGISSEIARSGNLDAWVDYENGGE